jgi:GNAT superfamily N-acetyltransferase
MGPLRVMVQPHAPEHLKQPIREGLGLYNVAATGLAEYYPVSIFLKDANDEVLRGVLGHIWGRWLSITSLWVAESARGQGYGTALLLAAEAYAAAKGCGNAELTTFSFQARPDTVGQPTSKF